MGSGGFSFCPNAPPIPGISSRVAFFIPRR